MRRQDRALFNALYEAEAMRLDVGNTPLISFYYVNIFNSEYGVMYFRNELVTAENVFTEIIVHEMYRSWYLANGFIMNEAASAKIDCVDSKLCCLSLDHYNDPNIINMYSFIKNCVEIENDRINYCYG